MVTHLPETNDFDFDTLFFAISDALKWCSTHLPKQASKYSHGVVGGVFFYVFNTYSTSLKNFNCFDAETEL